VAAGGLTQSGQQRTLTAANQLTAADPTGPAVVDAARPAPTARRLDTDHGKLRAVDAETSTGPASTTLRFASRPPGPAAPHRARRSSAGRERFAGAGVFQQLRALGPGR